MTALRFRGTAKAGEDPNAVEIFLDALRRATVSSLGVRRLFPRSVCEQTHHFLVTEFFGPCDQYAIAAYLVVLHRLRFCCGGGVRCRLVWHDAPRDIQEALLNAEG